MNRRGFLQGLGAVLIGLQVPFALAKQKFIGGQTWRQRLPMPTQLEELGPAIERLFVGDAMESVKAYEEFMTLGNSSVEDHSWQRCTHETRALWYYVQPDDLDNAMLERRTVQSLYTAMLIMAERPENRGVSLIWRTRPERIAERCDFENNEPAKEGIRMRLSLKAERLARVA